MAKKYTPIEQKLVDRLSDGRAHSAYDLMAIIDDPELVQSVQLRVHICNLRCKLPPGETIVCTKGSYQCVRLLASANTGRS